MANDPYYGQCCRSATGECNGRITWEHAIIYAGRQLNEKWAIIPLCAYHHSVDQHQDGDGLNKELNIAIALNRATNAELFAISKATDYMRMRSNLNLKYSLGLSTRPPTPLPVDPYEIEL